MKKSELKSYIKEMIVSELSEADLDAKSGAVLMKKGTNPSDIKKLTAQGLDVELKEEDEDFDAELTDKDVVVDPNDPFAKLKSQYEGVVKLMKSVVNKFKSAEGSEKQKYIDQLKNLTKIKKEIEAMLNPSMDDEEEI